MIRQEKYPDTNYFHYYNANPKNKFTEDCVCRAVTAATKENYATVLRAMCELSLKTGYSAFGGKGIESYMKSIRWVKHSQPRKPDNTKYTGKEFCELNPNITCVANIGGNHTIAIVNGKIWDTWNSASGCIGNYYTKEN